MAAEIRAQHAETEPAETTKIATHAPRIAAHVPLHVVTEPVTLTRRAPIAR